MNNTKNYLVACLLFVFSFFYAKSLIAAPLSISQMDIIDNPPLVQFSSALIDDPDNIILSNGNAVFSGKTSADQTYSQIYFYNNSTHTTTLVSLAYDGKPGEGNSQNPSISSNGRYIVFESDATNLVTGDTNGLSDIFVRDMQTGITHRVSVATDGTEGNDQSSGTSISSTGRYIVFTSNASNLTEGDENGFSDVFLRDTVSNTTSRISILSDGTETDGFSGSAIISADGRYIVFQSGATNLMGDGQGNSSDVYMYDTQTKNFTRVSVAFDGSLANGSSYSPAMSSDGKFVTFISEATNLIESDLNPYGNIYLRNIQNNTTVKVSVKLDGKENMASVSQPSLSTDGRYVMFSSTASNLVEGDAFGSDVFLRDTVDNTTTCISMAGEGVPGNNGGEKISISPDGRYILFSSNSSNLTEDDTNNDSDVFLKDTQSGITSIISKYLSSESKNSNSDDFSYYHNISADNKYVAFQTDANLLLTDNNSTDVFLRNIQLNSSSLISTATGGGVSNGYSYAPSISQDGRYVSFVSDATDLIENDTNDTPDVFLRDTKLNTTKRISVASDGTEGNGGWDSGFTSISDNGRYVAFDSDSSNLVESDSNYASDIFLRDTVENTTTMLSVSTEGDQGNDYSYYPSISSDGRYVVFQSNATNLISGSEDVVGEEIFLRDIQTGTTTLVSVASDGTRGNGSSRYADFSPDGKFVVFESDASNLVDNDTNGVTDIFLRNLENNTTTLISVGSDGSLGNNSSYAPSVSDDGKFIVFQSTASNLVAGDTNGYSDIFLRNLNDNTTVRVSTAVDGTEGDERSTNASISPDGSFVAFTSYATNLLPSIIGTGDGNYFLAQISEAVPEPVIVPPTITNGQATSITNNSAILISSITDTGGANVTARGFNYGLSSSYGTNVSDSGLFDVVTYTKYISDLKCNTTYHYRSYATNSSGTKYGSDQTFRTLKCGGGHPIMFAPASAQVPTVPEIQNIPPSSNNQSTENTDTKNTASVEIPKEIATELLPKLDAVPVIKPGITSSAVKNIQIFLNLQGYPVSSSGPGSVGNETNYYGLKTRQSVKKFQKDNNLVSDGIIGPKTKEVIKSILK